MDPEDGPYAHWHVPGVCDNLALSFRASCGQPPAYWVLAANGYWFSYCMSCTVSIRKIGAQDPDLAPLRVTTHVPPAGG